MSIQPQYSKTEEIWHSMIHGIGAAFAVAGLVVLVVSASRLGDPWRIVSFSIYGTSLFTLYLASTLYHSFSHPRIKHFFRRLDHLSIFFLIAGTYTPLTLISLHGAWGWTLFGIIWGMAVTGIIYEMLFLGKYKWISVTIYLVMGWCAVIAVKPMFETMPAGLLIWIGAGGVFYSGGVAFYVRKNMKWHHVIWHVCVLLGSMCHYAGFLLYLT